LGNNNSDGTWSVVSSLELVPEEFEAFNLTVQDFNTYFVGEHGKQISYWVNNSCPRYLTIETHEAVLKSADKYGTDNINLKIKTGGNNPARIGSLQITDPSGRIIGEIYDGKVIPIHNNVHKLYEVTRALNQNPVGSVGPLIPVNSVGPNGPLAIRVGEVENGYQTVLYKGDYYIIRDANTSSIPARDLDALVAHQSSHTIGRHGPDVTDEQLLLRAQTGIAPDGSNLGSPPPLSTRFGSNEQMVIAKDDFFDEIDAGRYTTSNDGTERIVELLSSDVYGQGIQSGAPAGTLPTDVTGVTARLRKDDEGVWQIVTMHPGPL